MDISEMVNSPVELKLGSKSYKFRKLTINDIYVDFANSIREEYLKNATILAGNITNKKDQMEFLTTFLKSTPKGSEMDEMIEERLGTMSGIAEIISKAMVNKELSKDEVIKVLMNPKDNENILVELSAIKAYIFDEKVEDEKK